MEKDRLRGRDALLLVDESIMNDLKKTTMTDRSLCGSAYVELKAYQMAWLAKLNIYQKIAYIGRQSFEQFSDGTLST